MQISELKIEGYRTLRNVSWKPGNLNIVIGPNASGKSNLLKLLELIKKSSQGLLSDEITHSGGIISTLWNGSGKTIRVVVDFGDNANNKIPYFDYWLNLEQLGNSNSFTVGMETLSTGQKLNDLSFERFGQVATYASEDGITEIDVKEIVSSETLLSQLKMLPGKFVNVGNIGRVLSNYAVHQELRTDSESRLRQPVISSYEEQLDADGQNLTSVLHTVYESDSDFQENIDRGMTAAFGNGYKGLAFPPAGSQRIELGLRWKSLSRPQPASVLSDGTLRFLFLITALSLPKLPSLICIDEPETGLHPSMLPIIAEYAANAAQRTQVVLTTHSVQFLDAFSEYNPTTTVAQLQDGETKLVTLNGDKLAYWLQNYSLGSLFSSGELENMAQDALDDDKELEAVGEDAE